MAMTLAQFGNGTGMVYITQPDGTTIVSNIENTSDVYQQVQNYLSTAVSLTDPTLQVDATFGYRVFGNTAGTAGSLVGASELTRFLVGRSGNAPNFKVPVTIATGVLETNRVSNKMTVMLETEGLAATDTLETISVANCVINDEIIIIGTNAGRVTTIDDSAGNIYLTNATNFATGNRARQIVLRYLEDGVGGYGWYETSRADTLPTVTASRTQGVPTPISGADITTLVAGGGTINLEAGLDKGTQIYIGTANLAASWVIQPEAAPATPYLDGDTMCVIYNANLTVGANSVTIFGNTLSAQQALEGNVVVNAIYSTSDAAWHSSVLNSDSNTTTTFANAAARALSVPAFAGQIGVQIDTDLAYLANGTAAGNWILVDPFYATSSGGDTYVLQKTIAGVYSFVPNNGNTVLFSDATDDATGANTDVTTLKTFTIDADTLSDNGDCVVIKAVYETAANANNKTMYLDMDDGGGLTPLIETGAIAMNGGSLQCEITITRITETSASVTAKATAYSVATDLMNTAMSFGRFIPSFATDFTVDITIDMVGQNGVASASDIVARQMSVELFKLRG